eukprot:6213297-Pleurochrysis_carterae.AAC.4
MMCVGWVVEGSRAANLRMLVAVESRQVPNRLVGMFRTLHKAASIAPATPTEWSQKQGLSRYSCRTQHQTKRSGAATRFRYRVLH